MSYKSQANKYKNEYNGITFIAPSSKAMTNAQNSYNKLVNGGYSGYAKANNLTDYTNRLNMMLANIQASKFNYDVNNDASYRAYNQMFQANAMRNQEDAIGRSAALTGGLASSYSQQFGNAAFQDTMQGLNDVQASLMNLAMSKYANDMSNKQSVWDLMNQQNQNQYSNYQNAIANSYNNLQYQADKYNTNYNRAFDKYNTDKQNAFNNWQMYENLNQQKLDRDQRQRNNDRTYRLQKSYYK